MKRSMKSLLGTALVAAALAQWGVLPDQDPLGEAEGLVAITVLGNISEIWPPSTSVSAGAEPL